MVSQAFVRSLAFLALASQASALFFTSSSSSSSSSSSQTSFAPLGSATDIFRAGSVCRAAWTPDTTGNTTWKSMTIQLMTGSNLQMTVLGTVARNVDGTNAAMTVYNYSCPQVTPNAAIYFLQYTHDDGQDPTWTTRFTIADASGRTELPPEANQPQGGSPAIPWGQGQLVAIGSGSTSSASSSSSSSSSSSTAATMIKSKTATAIRAAKTTDQQEQLANAFSSIFGNDAQGGAQSQYASAASRGMSITSSFASMALLAVVCLCYL